MEVTPHPHDVRGESGSLEGREGGACLVEAPSSSSSSSTTAYQPLVGTAFTRPPPSSGGPRDSLFGSSQQQPEGIGSERSAAALGLYPPALPGVSPPPQIKALNGGVSSSLSASASASAAYDRTSSYLSQFGLNPAAYTDYVTGGHHAAGITGLPHSYPDPHCHPHPHPHPHHHAPHGQTGFPHQAVSFSAVPGSGGGGGVGGGGGCLPGGPAYWGEAGRPHTVLTADPYAPYGAGHHGVSAASPAPSAARYDSYKSAALLYGGQEAAALGIHNSAAVAAAAARGYFTARASDGYQGIKKIKK